MSITEETIVNKTGNGLSEIQSAPFELDLSGGAMRADKFAGLGLTAFIAMLRSESGMWVRCLRWGWGVVGDCVVFIVRGRQRVDGWVEPVAGEELIQARAEGVGPRGGRWCAARARPPAPSSPQTRIGVR